MDSPNITQTPPDEIWDASNGNSDQMFLPEPFSYITFLYLDVCIRGYANGLLALTGVCTNLIVLVVFYRQGIFTNSSTVSLTALGVLDFMCSLLNLWGAVLSLILFNDTQYHMLPFSVPLFAVFTSMRPNDMLTQVTCWVTAYAAFERLISVTFPFKVKSIFTPKRSFVGIICLFVGFFGTYSPSMFSRLPKLITIPRGGQNLTLVYYLGVNNPVLNMLHYYCIRVNTIGLKAAAIVVVVLCNFAIYWKVNLSQKFRKTSGPSIVTKPDVTDNNEVTTVSGKKENKEKKLLKMIAIISVVFVLCYTPFVIFSIMVVLVLQYGVDYHFFTEHLMWWIVTFLQTINSSSNFFIYYIMSTRFRQEFQGCCSKGKTV